MIRYSEKPMSPGLFFLRAGTGFLLIIRGVVPLVGGPDAWVRWGRVMEGVGIGSLPGFWGFLLASIEFFGGVCLILGLFTRVFALLLFCAAGVFLASHLNGGGALFAAGRILLNAVLAAGILMTGPGRWSLDRSLFPPR